MSREARKKEKLASRGAPQLREYAFNPAGWVMIDKFQARNGIEYLIAYPPSGQYAGKVSPKGKQNESPTLFRDDLTLTAREKEEPEVGLKRYLIVGYMPRFPDTAQLKDTAKTHSKQGPPVGTVLPGEDGMVEWEDSAPPILVVTPVLATKPDGVQLYGLLEPKNGLCVPYMVKLDNVFYRSEFRSNVGTHAKRKGAWNAEVMRHAVRPDLEGQVLTSKQEKFKRARDPVRLTLEPNFALATEVACLAACFKESKDVYFLDEMKSVLESVDADLSCSLTQLPALRKFAEATEEFDPEDAAALIEEFDQMWGDEKHKGITVQNLMVLCGALSRQKLHIKYRHVKHIVAEGCYNLKRIDRFKNTEIKINLTVKESWETVNRLFGQSEGAQYKSAPLISASESEASMLLKTIIVKLREIVDAGRASEENVKGAFGDIAFEHGPDDIWETFGRAADTDTARAAFNAQIRLIIGVLRQKEVGIRGMVQDLLEPLEKLGIA